MKRGGQTNWKRQYKLRHNWTKGSCAVNEIQVAEEAAVPPILIQMHDGIIYMADQIDGLRAWSAKDERKMLAHIRFVADLSRSPPTSLAIDIQTRNSKFARVVAGFENGSYAIYQLNIESQAFMLQYRHEPSNNGVVTSVSVSWPYLITLTATQLLSLYHFQDVPIDLESPTILDPPRLLHSLKSHTVWPPLSTSLRVSSTAITISIAYAMPTYLSGWTVGIQEVKLSADGALQESRTASAIDQHYRPLAFALPPVMAHLGSPGTSLATSTTLELRHIHSKPTSLSYTHPYLLVSHPDNTLTLYLVSSTADSLSINTGSRLWGHTSSVSGAHVGNRGKAVSISKRGDELRIWELEGGFASSAARKRLASSDLSVRVQPERRAKTHSEASGQAGLDLVSQSEAATHTSKAPKDEEDAAELTVTRGWIGFDEESVVVLKEQSQGRQALVVYDFT